MTAGLAIVVLAALKVESATLNAGGHPLQGTKLGSASYRVSLDALGDSARSGLTSASFRLDGGFVDVQVELAGDGADAGLGYRANEMLVPQPVSDQFLNRTDLQSMPLRERDEVR